MKPGSPPFPFFTDYRGNFDMYVKLKDEKTKNAARVYEAYQTKRAHMMEFIEKFRGEFGCLRLLMDREQKLIGAYRQISNFSASYV